MFNSKQKTESLPEAHFTTPANEPSTNNKNFGSSGTITTIGNGAVINGDLKSNADLRVEGTVIGNIRSAARVIVGSTGIVEGDIVANQADILGKVSGNIRIKDLLQLKGDSLITGNIHAGKLQIEPTVAFNGQCHTGANVSETKSEEIEQEVEISEQV